jgi:hypothetical protein
MPSRPCLARRLGIVYGQFYSTGVLDESDTGNELQYHLVQRSSYRDILHRQDLMFVVLTNVHYIKDT